MANGIVTAEEGEEKGGDLMDFGWRAFVDTGSISKGPDDP